MAADQSLRDYGLASPHGPNVGGGHVATASIGDMSGNEQSVFRSLLLPDDSYDENGTYWADMGIMQRIRFVRKVDNEESKKELKSIGTNDQSRSSQSHWLLLPQHGDSGDGSST